jgi:tetraacyldisaccharide 4'-kinase
MKRPRVLRLVLWPVSQLYGGYVRTRAWLYAKEWLKRKRLRGRVISVGNLSVGGTGKTPMVIWLAERLLAEGKRVAILSRGYRGSGGTSDEIELMKFRLQNRVVFGVGKNRFREGQRIEAQHAVDVFLLDDGFQHLQLFRDLDILLIDATCSLGRESLLPAGNLREPSSAMGRANLLLFTRAEAAPGAAEAIAKLQAYPVFSATTRLLGFRRMGGDKTLLSVEGIGSGPFFGFCGIGNPEAFFRDLEKWGLQVSGTRAFPDHHLYTQADVAKLARDMERAGAKAFLTTEKDAHNLNRNLPPELPVYIAVIDLAISPEDEFSGLLKQFLTASTGAVA